MLKILDRYIIKKYLGAFFFTCILFSLISTVIDYSDTVDKFVNAEMTTKEIWLEYYLNFIPWINGILWPLFSLLSVIFITSRLAKNAEIISILNAGVSYWRFLRPFIISAILIGSLHLIGNHFVIPHSNQIRYDIQTERLHKNREQGKFRDIHIFITPESKIYLRHYNRRDTAGTKVRFETFQNGRITQILNVNKMTFSEAPNTWTLQGVYARHIDSTGRETLHLGLADRDTTINLFPSDFTYREHDKDGLVTPDLIDKINKEHVKGTGMNSGLLYELYRRTSDPYTILILTIIGASIASRKVRGGMGLHLAFGVLIGAVYIFISKFAYTFAVNDLLSPLLAVWMPNVVFTLLGVWLVMRAQQ